MKFTRLNAISLSVLLMLGTTHAQGDEWTGNISGIIGQKDLEEKDWPEHDEHGAIGMLLDVKKKDWPISIAIDLFGTGDEDKSSNPRYEGYTAEANIGLRKIFQLPIQNCRLRPYIGGGIALINAEEKMTTTQLTRSDEDSDTGYWLGIGSYYTVSERFHVGIDVRYSEAQVDLFEEEREVGGMMSGITVGYRW